MSELAALLPTLLPLRGLDITLRFGRATRLRPIHQPALTGFIRTLLDSPDGYDTLLTLDAPENGRIDYRPDDRYRFTLVALAGGEALLARAHQRLARLPLGTSAQGPTFGANIVLEDCRDHFSGRALTPHAELAGYGCADWAAEVAFWRRAERLRLRWLAPARLLRAKPLREQQRLKGDDKFCATAQQVSFALLTDRLHDSLTDLLHRRGVSGRPRWTTPALALGACDLFWVDARYQSRHGHEQSIGGVMGVLELPPVAALSDLALWVLGQYLGIGQNRAFGCGRYRLENLSGATRLRRAPPAATLLARALGDATLTQALRALGADRGAGREDASPAFGEGATAGSSRAHTRLRLEDLQARALLLGQYSPPPLDGIIQRQADGALRPLAVPPLADRVLQWAAAQQLRPALGALFDHRARQSVRRLIRHAYQDGYRWVYESDLAHFFAGVCWSPLRDRLQALLGDDPLIEAIMAWVSAPVRYQNHLIQRRRGLPSGSPLSPSLAYLMLDAFDDQLAAAGFKLARFADEVVVLCQDRAHAQAAAQAAARALAEVGLRIDPGKTQSRTFAQGFRYLGYLFVEGLALEVGEKQGPMAVPATPPPYDWLAELAGRDPAALTDGGYLPSRRTVL